VADGAW